MTDSFTYVHMWSQKMLSNKNGKYFTYRLITYLSLRQSLHLPYVITGPEVQQSNESLECPHVKCHFL